MSHPPSHPDIKRELQSHLLAMSARSFEFFAGDFLTYAGLENISVTRYIGDGGIDAHGNLVAGRFSLPIGVQVKRHRHNVQRPDIDRFIGALSGHFPEGLFMTTADYAPSALQKASASIPRVLTLNGAQIVSLMLEHGLGVTSSSLHSQQLDVDTDYFAGFEAMKSLLSGHINESSVRYNAQVGASGSGLPSDDQPIELDPADDLITLNALGYALRVDPTRVRRWVESGTLLPDAAQVPGGRTRYYFRRDRIDAIRVMLHLEQRPSSSAVWKQEFLDFARSRNLSRSYKPVMLKAFFLLVDRAGTVTIDDMVREFRAIYVSASEAGQPLERKNSLMVDPLYASDQAIKRLIVANPLERFLIKNFMHYDQEEETVQIVPQLWRDLLHYEVMDVLACAEKQIRYYMSREH